MAFSNKFFGRAMFQIAFGLVLALAPSLSAALPPPAFAPRSCLFTSNVTVTLSGTAKEIRYTLDGTEPGTNSPLYSAPLIFTNSVMVRARHFSGAGQAGKTGVEAYTLGDTQVAAFSSTLPLVIISTFGQAIPSPTKAPAWLQVIGTGTNQRAVLTAPADFAGPAKLKPRGFTSLRHPKRSYSVETLDGTGEAADVALLGMPADSDWVLYAPYPDKTLLRDVLAYELSNQLGHYASRTRFVEVFVNETTNGLTRAHYVGVYVLEEKVKIAAQRVVLHKLSPRDIAEPEITGGYLFKKDHFEKIAAAAPVDAPVSTRPPVLAGRYPTGPGGFPAAPAGFLPDTDPPVFLHAVSIATNTVNLTNAAGTAGPVVVVSVARTNALITAGTITVTNAVILTNLVVSTNWPVATNALLGTKTVVSTNPVVATQSVSGTNAVATTNQVDANTTVITTTLALSTTATYRTNWVLNTNTFTVTNYLVVTNMLVVTNPVVLTNLVVASLPVLLTNQVLMTNLFTLGPPGPPAVVARLVAGGEGFVTSRANAFFFVEPKATKITPAQRAWLTNYLNRFEAALHGPDFRHATNGYPAFLDVDSFIDHHLFVEATKNIDGYRFSTYFTKERGGKLKMEPVWDWNLSMGNARSRAGYLPEQWYWPQLDDQQYSWFRRLFEDPDFGQRYVDRWARWRTQVFSTTNLLARVDHWAAVLQEPAARNFERWPILGELVTPNYFAGKTYAEEIQYLKSWLTNRVQWMDAQFVPPPVMSPVLGGASSNVIQFTAPTGQLFFTVDGSDPRLAGGTVSSAARVYETPVPATNAAIVVRTRRGSGWSSPVNARVVAQP